MADKFAENFEKVSQTNYYVGVTRFKDVKLFNYSADSNPSTMIGITHLVEYIEIQNSVDHSFRVGRISIKDNLDVRTVLPLIGNEILYIEYNSIYESSVASSLKKRGFFRIMSLENTTDSQLINGALTFTDRELIFTIAEYPYIDLLTFNNINKTYSWDGGSEANPPKGPASIGTLVQNMFTDPTSSENIINMGITYSGQTTRDQLPVQQKNYYSPNWSRLKNINFLKRFASSMEGNNTYYFLNCQEDKITFKSIYSEFLSPITKKINSIDFMPSNFYNLFRNVNPSNPTNVLMDINYKIGNGLSALFSGQSGGTHFSFDYLSGHVFSVNDYRTFKKTESSNQKYYINYTNTGNGHSSISYSPFTDPEMIKNLKRYEYAKKSFNSMVCEATTFISQARYLGQTARIATPKGSAVAENFTSKLDPVYGDEWCIWGYKDIIVGGRGICKLTLKKESTDISHGGLFGSMIVK
jgi:hypothetical protein